jgi:peptidyl-prolyl cis-trans isomerase A (cyclophilin A)
MLARVSSFEGAAARRAGGHEFGARFPSRATGPSPYAHGMHIRIAALSVLLPLSPCFLGCSSDSVEGSGAAATSTTASGTGGGASTSTATSGTGGAGGDGGAACGPDSSAPDEVLGTGSDPEQGDFTLEEALAGLPEGPGPLRAILSTELGDITCTLYPEDVPVGVANFVGLARGTRPWKDPVTHEWVKRRFYDGLTFHRIIDDFVAQGGDPKGNGTGGPGYDFADEITTHTHGAGTLAYANAGADTNGSQFYITETPQPFLDGDYVVFGDCLPLDVIQALCAVPTVNESPVTPVHTTKVEITRCAP